MASPTARPTMPSADFCTGVRVPRGPLSLVSKTRRRPPEVSSIAFTAHPPDLQPRALDGYGLRDQLSARPTRAASYPVSVCAVERCRSSAGATPARQLWSFQPVAIGAAVEVTKPSEPSMERVVQRPREQAGRNVSERRAGLETDNVGADPPQKRGRPPSLVNWGSHPEKRPNPAIPPG
jgi:hypothetical protein